MPRTASTSAKQKHNYPKGIELKLTVVEQKIKVRQSILSDFSDLDNSMVILTANQVETLFG